MKDVNLGTITGTQSWYKIWPLIGFGRTRAEQKNFSGDGKEFTEISRAVGKAESH